MIKKPNYQLSGAYAFLILAQTMVGINIVGSKYLVASVPFLFILTARFSLAAIMLFSLHLVIDPHPKSFSRHLKTQTKKNWIYIVLQAITAGVLFNWLMIMGLRYTNANIAGIITSGLPAIIALMSWIALKEPFTRKKNLCLGLATIGLLIISSEKFLGSGSAAHLSMLGNFLILLSLLPEATYYVLSKIHINSLPVFLLSAVINSINALIMMPVLFFYMDWHLLHLMPFDWLIVVIVSASSALFFVFWSLGSYRVDAVVASLSTAIMPIATVVIAWLTLGEVITPLQLLGMGLVIASIFVCAPKSEQLSSLKEELKNLIVENDQIRTAKKINNPTTVIQMRSGFVVMNQSQFLTGYCLLLAYPQVSSLNDLPLQQRAEFLTDMGLIGEAIQIVCQPTRINYAILGNKDPFLHAHLIPRYDWESTEFKPLSIWRYPDEIWSNPQYAFSAEKHDKLRDAIKQKLLELMKESKYVYP